MVRMHAAVVSCGLLLVPCSARAAEPPQLETKIESVGLFKNGLAVVRRSVTLPNNKSRTFDITDLPEPVHGTFWVESSATLEISVTNADVPATNDAPLPTMTNEALKGSMVTVFFKSEHLAAITGRVATPPQPTKAWNKNYGWSRPTHQWWWSGFDSGNGYSYLPGAAPAAASLVLETEAGEVVLDVSTIAYLRVDERVETPTVRRPVLRVRVESAAPGDIDVGILYLTKGASWAPSYEVVLDDSSHVMFRQSAVIRNELEDWDGVELLLITGFPSIEFGHVLSPMSPATNLSSFFRALGTENRISHSSRGDVMSQAVMYNDVNPAMSIDAAAVQAASLKGDDLQYHSIGKRTLLAGDSMVVQTAAAEAEAEQIVVWMMPDDRDEWGRPKRTPYQATVSEHERTEPHDAVRFRNPLDRAMTTAPAMVVRDGFVRGQSMVYWAAPGEEVLLPINKTLSVRAWAFEVEREDAREGLEQYGYKLWRTKVDGEVTIVNQRAEPVDFVAQIEFSGNLLEAEGEPDKELRPHGVWRLNPQRRLTWELTFQPGETRALKYSYEVLAPR